MRIEINAGGLGGGLAVSSFQSNMKRYLSKTDGMISGFQSVQTQTYNLNGGVGSLSDALAHIFDRIGVEEDRKRGAQSVQKQSNDFLDLAVRVDKEVATLVNQNKERFYQVHPNLKPVVRVWGASGGKSWGEQALDWLSNVGDAIQKTCQDVWDWATNAADKAAEWVKNTTDGAVQWAKEKWSEVKVSLGRAWNFITDFYASSGLADKLNKLSADVSSGIQGAGEYLWRSVKKLILGDYSDDNITLLSFGASLVAGFFDVDLPLDVRDLVYDIQHWGESEHFGFYFALDVVALLPVIGWFKYLKHADKVAEGAKQVSRAVETATEAIDEGKEVIKHVDDVVDIIDDGKTVIKNGDEAADVIDEGKGVTKGGDEITDGSDVARNAEKGAEDVADATDDVDDAAKSGDDLKQPDDQQKPDDPNVKPVFDKPAILTQDSIDHLRQEKIRGKNVDGGHNLQSFENTITKNGGTLEESVISIREHPTIKGIYDYEYKVPDGKGGYKAPAQKAKTVYNPKEGVSDSDIIQWANEAFNNPGRKTGGQGISGLKIGGQASNGLWFEGYINEATGEIKVFYPTIDPPDFFKDAP